MNLDELQRLAEGATPSPWEWVGAGLETNVPSTILDCGEFSAHVPSKDDAAYIAAMSPDTAKKLIAVARAAEKALPTLEYPGPSWANERENVAAALRTALEELK